VSAMVVTDVGLPFVPPDRAAHPSQKSHPHSVLQARNRRQGETHAGATIPSSPFALSGSLSRLIWATTARAKDHTQMLSQPRHPPGLVGIHGEGLPRKTGRTGYQVASACSECR
jgi:hypothetical protein